MPATTASARLGQVDERVGARVRRVGHGLARAGRIELRIDEQRVTRGRDAQGRGADQGQVHGARLAQPLLESLSVSLREFYAPHYTVTDPAEGERLGRWRALGAANKAAHVAALCPIGRAPWWRSAAATGRCWRRCRSAGSARGWTGSRSRPRRRSWRG